MEQNKVKATINKQIGNVLYIVELQNGKLQKRHIYHLREYREGNKEINLDRYGNKFNVDNLNEEEKIVEVTKRTY